MTPEELFHEATEELWNDDRVDYGYFMPKSSVWHLPDGRNLKVTFQEVTISNI